MTPGQIVYQGKSNTDKEIIFRYPTKNDLKSVWEYINALSKEQTFLILFQGQDVPLDEENKWLEGMLGKINQGKAVQLFVFVNKQLAGVSDIIMKDKAEKHVGVFGITISKDYRNEGIGTLLMEKIIKEAKQNLKELKILTLACFADNEIAIKLYKKMGFVEYGKLPKGLIRKGKFTDHIYMFKEI